MEAPRFDVFLSHRSGDKPAVEELARRLMSQGIEPWLDKWNLVPGEPWQEEIEKALSNCDTVAICLGTGGFGPWQHEEMRAAIDRQVQGRTARVIPVLLPGAERGERSPLPAFLASKTWVEFRSTLDDEYAFHRLVCGIRGIEPGPSLSKIDFEGSPPYRGLQPFGVGDAGFFFGREALTEWLLDKLRPARVENRFLAVIGPSGSGKSSLARAGLLASLAAGGLPGSENWSTAICRPGPDPLESLALALAKPAGLESPPSAVRKLIRELGEDSRLCHLTTRLAMHDAPAERRFVLLVDQFEEVFTLCSDEGKRRALIDNLLYAATVADGRTIVLLTLRADFYGRCAVHPGLAAALSDRQVLVGAMTESDLRSAIERPATLVGCELGPGLTDLLLEELEGEPGSLPLLQHALLELWNRRKGRRLTVEAYREIGGVRGALEQHAEEVYGSFSKTEQEICRKVFLRLVQPGEDTAATRRRLAVSELGGEEIGTVLRRLTDARLLTAGGEDNPTIELAHEALTTGWKRFQNWIENDHEALLVRRRLDEAVAEWTANRRDLSFLYRGGRLAQAEEWALRRPDEVSESKREFLNASIDHRDEESRRERARTRRLRLLSYGLAAGLILAMIAAGLAIVQRNSSEKRRRIVLAQNLAQKVQLVLPSESPLGLLLAAEAVRLLEGLGEPAVEEEKVLRWALFQSKGRALESGRVHGVGTTPDRRFLVTAGVDGTARLWDLTAEDPGASGRFLVQLDEGVVSALALTNDRRWLLTRVADSARARIFLRDLTSKDGPRELPGEDWLDSGHPFSPDSRWLVTASTGRPAELRDLRSADPATPVNDSKRRSGVLGDWSVNSKYPAEIEVLLEKAGPVQFSSVSPKNRWVVTQRGNEPPHLWTVAQPFSVEPLTSSLNLGFPSIADVFSLDLASSGNGRFLLVANSVSTLVRDLDTKVDHAVKMENQMSPSSFFWALDFDGSQIAAAREDDNGFLLWRRTSEGFQLVPHIEWQESFSVLTFSPDGRWLASGDRSGVVLLWDLENPRAQPRALTRHKGAVTALAFDSRGISLVSGGEEGSVRRYNLSGSKPKAEVRDAITALAISPDREWLAVADNTGKVEIWKDGGESLSLSNLSDALQGIAFSPDGRLLAGVSRSDTVQLWRFEGEQASLEPLSLPALPVSYGRTATFSSESQLITTSIEPTGTIYIQRWETKRDGLVKIACRTVGRNLTQEEWKTHLPGEPYNPLEPCPNLPPGE